MSQPASKKDLLKQFKEQSGNARHEAMSYIDLAVGESGKYQVLIEKGVTVQEVKSEKGDFKKVVYQSIDLKTGKQLEMRLTPRQAGKLEEEVEKLLIRDFDPVVRLKKIDSKTLDIERLPPNS